MVKRDGQRLRRPVMIVAVSTSLPQYRALYSQARELGRYMLSKMAFDEVAAVRSSSLGSDVIVGDDGVSALPACRIHAFRGPRDVLLFTGDSSPMEDQYQFARLLLDYAREMGVTELFSVGARWAENPVPPESDPQPNGFATDAAGARRLKKFGVKLVKDEPAPFFASIVVGLAAEYGIRGYKLSVDHGEPSPHSKSVAKMLGILSEMVGFEIQMDELRSQASVQAPPRQTGDSSIYH